MKVGINKWVVYFISVLNSILLIFLIGVKGTIDSVTYIDAWDNSISCGLIDECRTPIYPIFLGLVKAIAGESSYTLAIIFQHVVFLVSVIYFNKIADWIIQSHKMVLWLTLLYAILPATSSWANFILTESFAISGVVFLFYNLLKYHRKPSWSCVFGVTFWLLLLIFLRPAFLYLLPAIFIAWILFFKDNSFKSFLGFLGILFVALSVCGYSYSYKEKYGIFAITSVSVVNQAFIAFNDGLMKPEYTDNDEFKSFINENKDRDPSGFVFTFHKDFSLDIISRAIRESQKDQPLIWIKNAIGRSYHASQMPWLVCYLESAIIADMVGLKIICIYLFLLLFGFFLIKESLVKRKIYKISTLLLIAIFGNIVTVIIGAQGEWGRLLIPSFPLILLLVGELSNFLSVKEYTEDALS